MSGELPPFRWQREYNSKWTNYLYEEICIINKAVMKKQRTVTLPVNNPQKRITINLEKMYQKNLVSGFEQRIRCLVFNDSYISWSWQDDYDELVCFTPRAALYLEIAHVKQLDSVDIILKDEYEVNLKEFFQVNKVTRYTRPVLREEIEMSGSQDRPLELMRVDVACRDFMRRLCEESNNSIQTYIFDLPALGPNSQSNTGSLQFQNEIITALSEVEASSSTKKITSIPVDPDCPVAKNCQVYCEDSDIYSATLNLTNLRDNNNKFFIIQLLKYGKKKKFAVWFHWGRVGYKGQNNLIECGANLEEAKSFFEKKFYDKTRNDWSERSNFVKVPSKYDLVHVQLGSEVSRPLASAETKLDLRIQNLLQIICNKKNLEEAAQEMCYDSNATPLGKITARQIVEGYGALDQITKILKSKGMGTNLVEACNTFYTKIPHNFGRRTPPLIKDIDAVKEKLKMLEALSNICLAMDVLNTTADASENIIDKYYRSLDCNLIPLDRTSEKFRGLTKCLLETHGPTHCTYSMELIDAFLCVKEDQESVFDDLGNKKLLWHGSRVSNWIGILKKGLRIAPPEAPSTGYMFGKGIYFADVSSKSANYCFATKKKNEGLLLLSEVSLGNSLIAYDAADHSKLPDSYHSVTGVGKIKPRSFETTVLSPEASVPCGPLEEDTDENLSLNYNEYIVYNICQIKMKYLLRIRFNFK